MTSPVHRARPLGIAAPPLGCKLPLVESFSNSWLASSADGPSSAENRRVSNRRLSRELGYQLRYPSYRQGLSRLSCRELSVSGTPK